MFMRVLKAVRSNLCVEIFVRLLLLCVFCALERARPYHRVIKQEELWLYKHPSLPDTIPSNLLLVLSIAVPLSFIVTHLLATRDKADFTQAIMCLSLAALLHAVISNVIKVSVGRPRPDFFYRCFPGGEMTPDLACTGDPAVVEEGRKSFPSGHTGWVFCCFGFLSLYLCGKLHCFLPAGQGQGWRLCVVLTPLLVAAVVGISRMQDYRHHCEDVLAGAWLGSVVVLLCYHQYYPAAFSANCHAPYPTTGSTPGPTAHPEGVSLPVSASRSNLRRE